MATNKNEVKGKILSLYPEQIRIIPGFNTRYDMGDMKALANSITENGILQAVKVRKTKDLTSDNYPVYELIDGHRRTKAASVVQEKTGEYVMIPAEEVDLPEVDMVATMLTTGTNNQQLNMLERAYGIKKMMDLDPELKQADVARKIGVSQPHVADCLLLLTATPSTIKQIKSGAIAASAIVTMLKTDGGNEIDEHLDKAIAAAEAAGKEKVTKKDVDAAAGKKKGGAAAKSTKQGLPEEAAGPVEKLTKKDEDINKLIGLKDALLSEDREPNNVALATLDGLIYFLRGDVELIDIAPVFFHAEGDELPRFGPKDEEPVEAPGKKSAKKKETPAAPAPKVEAAKPAAKETPAKKSANGKPSLKEAFAELEAEATGGKKAAKKAAAPKAEPPVKKSVAPKKAAELEEEEPELEEIDTDAAGGGDDEDLEFDDIV